MGTPADIENSGDYNNNDDKEFGDKSLPESSGKSSNSSDDSHSLSSSTTSEPSTSTSPDVKNGLPADMSEKRIWKNEIVLSLVFFLNFVAYNGLSSLQSSIHVQQGMGVITQAIVYAFLSLGSLFLAKITIRLLGHKWTITFSLLGYVLWMAANGYAVWATMIPASIILGVCSATAWTAQSSYLTLLATHYALKSKEDKKAVVARFFGIFYAFYKFSGVIGAIISSTLLNQQPENLTQPSNQDLQIICGLNDCPNNLNNVSNSNFDPPSDKTLWTLVGVYIGVGVLGFILSAVFLDVIPSPWLPEDQRGRHCSSALVSSSLFAAIIQMRHVPQLLLIPLTFYSGLDQTFLSADYTKSFVSCFLGIWMVGFTTIPEMVTNAIVSFTGGRIMTCTGFLPVFLTGVAAAVLYQVFLLVWSPSLNNVAFFYLIPCLDGFSDGVFQVQITAAHGLLFPASSDAAFANFKLWQSMGRIQAFIYSSIICTETKLYILLGFLILGIITFFLLIIFYIKNVSNNNNAYDLEDTKTQSDNDVVYVIRIDTNSLYDQKVGLHEVS